MNRKKLISNLILLGFKYNSKNLKLKYSKDNITLRFFRDHILMHKDNHYIPCPPNAKLSTSEALLLINKLLISND